MPPSLVAESIWIGICEQVNKASIVVQYSTTQTSLEDGSYACHSSDANIGTYEDAGFCSWSHEQFNSDVEIWVYLKISSEFSP